MKRILIGCARSGVMARAFRARGWEAWECDTEPTRDTDNARWHIQGDVLAQDPARFDAAFIHPPCTYLSVSGLHWNKRRPERAQKTADAYEFFMACWALVRAVGRGGLENPIGCMSTLWRKPDQIVQPWQFGDDASKATCLWLHNAPKLAINPAAAFPPRYVCTDCGKVMQGYSGACSRCAGERVRERWSNQTDSGQNKLAPSADRAEKRSETYPGIAAAIAAALTAP